MAEMPGHDGILTVNGGSSSIKFAVFAPGARRVLGGEVERVGTAQARLLSDGAEAESVAAATFAQAADGIIAWLRERTVHVAGVGHRIVHGGVGVSAHQLVTPDLIAQLRRALLLDLAHLGGQIALLEHFGDAFPGLPQVACFDTAFGRDLPQVAQVLPIPRKYFRAGVRRLGFHGLSYEYLLGRLTELGAAQGRVILAHLGSGASMAAVRDGKPVDMTMAFTPAAGLVMGTRPGDLDPGLVTYLMRQENLGAAEMDNFISTQCGMLGVSETSSDMRDLLARSATDDRAANAVALFSYQAKKFVGALTAALGGLDTLVFAGGIGEHSPQARAGICQGLECLGIVLDAQRNAAGAEVISSPQSRVSVRVIPTDEEVVIARTVERLIPGIYSTDHAD